MCVFFLRPNLFVHLPTRVHTHTHTQVACSYMDVCLCFVRMCSHRAHMWFMHTHVLYYAYRLKWKFPPVFTEQHSSLYRGLLICLELVSVCIVLKNMA